MHYKLVSFPLHFEYDFLPRTKANLSFNYLPMYSMKSAACLQSQGDFISLIVVEYNILIGWTVFEVDRFQFKMILCHSCVYLPSIGFLLNQGLTIHDLNDKVNSHSYKSWVSRRNVK